jgi:hypothetical protein
MGKEKEDSTADDGLDLFDDDPVIETDVEEVDILADDLEKDNASGGETRKASSNKLEVKRRLDAYLERKWFREHGWDDDDELFNDDFFAEEDPDSLHHV